MNTSISHAIQTDVADYYAQKIAQFGQTARGVDWNGEESQQLRFAQLCKIIESPGSFSINDLGCGYAALLDYLSPRYTDFGYLGVDLADAMVQAATQRFGGRAQTRFLQSHAPDTVADYGVASGIFSVRLEHGDEAWRNHMESTLDALDQTSRLGFAFNCLTSYSDADRKKDYLYYADPCALFDLCKRRYSRQVALLHDYGLYEFTILVRKSK